jgi:uncharacterized protein (TIGR02147 family)
MKNKPIIFAYNNFREYLADFYAYRSEIDPKFTKAFICKQLGLPNSRSYFADVLNGKPVSPLKVPLFIKLLQLSKEEAQFFRILVSYNQATDDLDERELLFEQLISLNRTPKAVITPKEYAYYKDWYHSVIRAVLNIIDIHKDKVDKKLSSLIFPPVTEAQAKSSVSLLLELGLIEENSSGFLKPTKKTITTGPLVKDELIRQYQLKSLEIARQAIIKNKEQPIRVITKMISVSEEGYKRIEKRLEKFNAEINSIVHKDEKIPDRVYQFDMVLFPHLKYGFV